MNTGYEVIWTNEAERNLQSILIYLKDNWSSREINLLLEKLLDRERLLSRQPEAFPLVDGGKGYRRSVLTKQVTIYYKLEEEAVKIHYLFDTRQDPDKLNLGG